MTNRDDAGGEQAWTSLALDVAMSPILLSGFYAWSIAIAPALTLALHVFDHDAAFSIRAYLAIPFSALALAPIVVGAALRRRGSPLAPIVGVWGFLGCALLTWLCAPSFIDVAHLDPTRGFLGSAGFALYALAWGTPRTTFRSAPEDDPRAELSAKLEARDRLPRRAIAIAAIGVLTAGGLVAFAFQPTEGPRSLVAHCLAGALSVAALSTAATVATARVRYVAAPARVRLSRGSANLAVLVLLCGAGFAYWMAAR